MKARVTFHGQPASAVLPWEAGDRLEVEIPEGTASVVIENTGDCMVYAGGETLRSSVNGMPVAPHSLPIEIHGMKGTLALMTDEALASAAGTSSPGTSAP